jgi:hypothetical protein
MTGTVKYRYEFAIPGDSKGIDVNSEPWNGDSDVYGDFGK